VRGLLNVEESGGWRLHPQVAVRPEPFGALLYHFGTRKLSFLKSRTILEVVESLGDHPDIGSALDAAGVEPDGRGPYLHALGVLAQSQMLVPAVSASAGVPR
jgi:mycofactocin biosynthesis protein MftB